MEERKGNNISSLLEEPNVTYQVLDDSGVYQLIHAVRKGLLFKEFETVYSRLTFNLQEWASFLHLSERTLQRYKKENKGFDSLQSERILQIVLLHKFGKEVFGSDENYNQWLASRNVSLGNITPKSLFDNSFGIELVKNELGRIQHGVLA